MASDVRVTRHSSRRTEQSELVKKFARAVQKVSKSKAAGASCTEYQSLIARAKRCVGYGQVEGAFPEEWDAQLLVDCGRTEDGHRLVLFCPEFLVHSLDDPDELDLALRFILLSMDAIAMHDTYVFVYCCLGLDWRDQRLMERLRFVYDFLPPNYNNNLMNFYVLHSTNTFKVQMWTFRFWLSQRLWDRIEYTENIQVLCGKVHPNSEGASGELRRRFPQVVQRRDAELVGREPPVTFGVPLEDLCNGFGVDFTDKTTGRWYPRLPPPLVFLCEVMEREAADEDFGTIFSAQAASIYKLVETVDHGKPFEHDIPSSTLWCILKLFLDCLPTPLLSFEVLEEIANLGLPADDMEAQCRFLQDLLHHRLPREMSYVALYLASFLHTLCRAAESKEVSRKQSPDCRKVPITFALATKVFTPNFLRPHRMTDASRQNLPAAYQIVETLLRHAEDDRLWIGRKRTLSLCRGANADVFSSSESEEGGGVAALGDRLKLENVDASILKLAEGLDLGSNELAQAGVASDESVNASASGN